MVQTFIPSASFSIAFNSAISVGFLGILWCFHHLSFIPACLLTLFFGFLSYTISLMLIHTISRAESYLRMKEDKLEPPALSLSLFLKGIFINSSWAEDSMRVPFVLKEKLDSNILKYEVKSPSGENIEMADLHRLFLGRLGLNVYCMCLILGLLSLSMGYSIFFCTHLWEYLEMSECAKTDGVVSVCRLRYLGLVCIYTAVIAILTYKGLSSQLLLQRLAALLRIFIISIMLATALHAISLSQPLNDSLSYLLPSHYTSTPFSTYGTVLIFLTSFQMMIPSMLKHLNPIQSITSIVFKTTLLLILLSCLLGGIVSRSLQNHAIPYLASLAWKGYSAGYSLSDRPLLAILIEYTVVFFPLLNILTSAPIINCTLISNLERYFEYEYSGQEANKKSEMLCSGVCIFGVMSTCWFWRSIEFSVVIGVVSYYLIFISNSILFLVSTQKIPFPKISTSWNYLAIFNIFTGVLMGSLSILSIYNSI